MRMAGLFKPNVEEMEKRKDIIGLMKALKHEDGNVQWRATEALGRIGEPAVEPLIHALKDEDRNVRWRAAEILGGIGDFRAVESLLQALMDGDYGVREHVARALGRIGDAKAVEPLAQALRDKSSYVRWEAAEALDKLSWNPRNDMEKAHYLLAKLSWGELIILGEPAIEPLIQASKDEDRYVREAAEEALKKIKASMLANIPMTKRLVHVFIYTEEPFEENVANIAGCVVAAFPEQMEKFDPATGSFTLREKKFGYSLVRSITFKDKKSKDDFVSWIKSVKEGVHDLPRESEFMGGLGTPTWGTVYFRVLLKRINPEFATSTAFVRKWSVINGKLLVIGVYSIVPQEVPAAPSIVPAPPQPEAPKPPEALPTKKYCTDCGADLPVEAVYCPRCGKKQVEVAGKMKSRCTECGQKMTITSEGVFLMGRGEPNIVKLRCERCNLTRFEKKADIERELGRTLPREFTLTPQQY